MVAFGSYAVALILVLSTLSPAKAACNKDKAGLAAGNLEHQLSVLVQFTSVICSPFEDDGKCSIACTSHSRHSETNIGVLLTAISAVGVASMRPHGLANFRRITFADRNLLDNRRRLEISVAAAERAVAVANQHPNDPLTATGKIRAMYSERPTPAGK